MERKGDREVGRAGKEEGLRHGCWGDGLPCLCCTTVLHWLVVWHSGVVVSTLALINEVNLRRTQLVLRWVTVSGSIPGAGHLFQYVTNQPHKANSAFHPSGVGKFVCFHLYYRHVCISLYTLCECHMY